MSPARLALVRHGETDWNARNLFQGRTDRPLDDVGHRQAAFAAEHLATWSWGRVVSSPLTRAQETAATIAEHLRAPLAAQPWDELTERSFGSAEGLDRDSATARWPDLAFPGSETLAHLQQRIDQAWERLIAAPVNTIAVTHVVIVRGLVLAATGTDPGFVGNASSTVLERIDGSWAVTSYVDPRTVTAR